MKVSILTCSKIKQSLEQAADYLYSRQCINGGFCFYRLQYLEQPNLADTYFAVKSLVKIGLPITKRDVLIKFLNGFSNHTNPLYLFYYLETIELLDAPFIKLPHLECASALAHQWLTKKPTQTQRSSWLSSSLPLIRLLKRYNQNPSSSLGLVLNQYFSDFHVSTNNIQDTHHALVLSRYIENFELPTQLVIDFIKQLQIPSIGFKATLHARQINLDTIFAGMACCKLMAIPVLYMTDNINNTLACQTSRGGFSRTPAALQDIYYTHLAVYILSSIDSSF